MLRFRPPEPTAEQLKARSASGVPGCVAAQKAKSDRLHAQLRREVQGGRG